MNPSVFGEVQTLISLFLQLTIFLSVLSLVAVNLVANSSEKVQSIVTELQLAAVWLAGGLLLVTLALMGWLQDILRFSSGWPFALLAVALVAAVPFTFQTAYLRGRQQFGATSLANMLVAGSKIVFSVGFVLVGFGTSGAIGGLIVAHIVGLAYALSQVGSRPKEIAARLHRRWWPDMGVVMRELGHVGYALVGLAAVMLLLSLDVVLVKYFFDAHSAGLYAGVATVARIVFFLSASVAQVLLPSVKPSNTSTHNHSLLIKSALIVGGLSLPVLVLSLLAPSQLMDLLMGSQYLIYSHLLWPLSLAVFFVSLLNLLVSYCLALRHYTPIVWIAIGALVTLMAMIFYHDSLTGIVNSLLVGSGLVTCLVGGWCALNRNKETYQNAS